MGKGTRSREAARIRIEQMRAAEVARQKRRRLTIATSVVVVVVLVIGGLVALKAAGVGSSKGSTNATYGSTPLAANVAAQVTSVPAATLDTVGAGAVTGGPTKITAPALSDGSKPKVLYVGAEYCPYCAAERWGMAVALSRFGTFTGLGMTHSSATDVDPSTPTLSFHGSTFASTYLSFVPYEQTTNQPQGTGYKPLDTLTAADQQLFTTYDASPYVTSGGSIPFVDFGGKYVISGASYDPALLAGKTQAQIAAALSNASSPIAKAIDGNANAITVALCAMTGEQPSAVCTSKGVQAAAAGLGSG